MYTFLQRFLLSRFFVGTPEKEIYQQQMRVDNEHGNEWRDRKMEKDVETIPYRNIGATGLQQRTVRGRRRGKDRGKIKREARER